MAVPVTREEFKEFCLRKLGKPVIDINVSDEQVEDRIDESLKYFQDYHFDGAQKTYYKVQVTSQMKSDQYIPIPSSVIGVTRVLPIGSAFQSSNIFNIQYQIAMNEIWTLTSLQLVPYYMAMEHLALIQELFVGQQRIRFNRHENRLYIDTEWDRLSEGSWIVVECSALIDPTTYTDVWGDRWLQQYTSAKIKYQWGSNLSKFTGLSLPGGVQFNGQQIKEEAEREILDLESKMLDSFSLPPDMMVG
jgi:hypothetical protein